jgi:exosortase/archaeosortase family protein
MNRPSPLFRFALKFIVIFALLIGAFEASRGSVAERFLVEDLILKPTVALIQTFAPTEGITLVGRNIKSPTSNLHVTRGCEGVEIFLILAAGVLAFPSDWKARLLGLGIGFVLAYVLSIVRLTALHFILRYDQSAWDALHGLVLPLGPIILISLYFMVWSDHIPQQTHESRKNAA